MGVQTYGGGIHTHSAKSKVGLCREVGASSTEQGMGEKNTPHTLYSGSRYPGQAKPPTAAVLIAAGGQQQVGRMELNKEAWMNS